MTKGKQLPDGNWQTRGMYIKGAARRKMERRANNCLMAIGKPDGVLKEIPARWQGVNFKHKSNGAARKALRTIYDFQI